MICLLNFLRYRQGVSSVFNEGYEDPNQSVNPNEQYRQAPFNNNVNNNSASFNANAGYQAAY